MKQRDLFSLNEIAKYGNFKGIYLSQKGDYAVAESTNGFCYLRIAEKNNNTFNDGFFSFTGNFIDDDVPLPQGYEILSSQGKKIGVFVNKENLNIPLGNQGEFFCTFRRNELLDWLRKYLLGWKSNTASKYMLIFHRDTDIWRLRGYAGKKVFLKELEPFISDTVTDKSFRFAVNPHTLRTIFKWFESDEVKLYFKNGNYECRSAIYMSDNNKLAVLMPIARKQ